jgi:hypothetical protein
MATSSAVVVKENTGTADMIYAGIVEEQARVVQCRM